MSFDPEAFLADPNTGVLEPGNIDYTKQPAVDNPDGGKSTVFSRSYNFDGKEYLLPSVTPDGRFLKTDAEVIAEYRKTGRHMGIYADPESANLAANQIHQNYAAGKYSAPAADFNPDAFLADTAPAEFNPDAFLATPASAADAQAKAAAANRDLAKGLMDNPGVVLDPLKRGLEIFGQKVIASPPVQAAKTILEDPLVKNLTKGNPLVRGTIEAIPQVPAAGLRATGTVAGVIAGSGAGPLAPVAVPLATSAGYAAFDQLAQQYEKWMGLRQEIDPKETQRGAVMTGVGFALPMPPAAIQPTFNLVRQGTAGMAVGATAEKAAQVVTGENDPAKVYESAFFVGALSTLGGMIQNAQNAQQRLRVVQAAKDLGYEGDTFGGVEDWWRKQDEAMRMANMRRVSPEAPAASAGEIPAQPAAPEAAPVAVAPQGPAPIRPPFQATPQQILEARLAASAAGQGALAPAAPAGQLPAPQGTRPTPNASLDSRGIPAPGVGGDAQIVPVEPAAVKAQPSAEPVAPETQTVYGFDGKRAKIPADQPPGPNQVTADQWAELRTIKKEKGADAFKKAWQKTLKANERLAANVAKNANSSEAVQAGKRSGLKFRGRPDGVVDIIDAIQELGGVPKPGPERGGQFDGWEDAFRGPARVLVGKRQGGWDSFMQDLVATYPQFAHLEGAYAEQVGAEIQKALESRTQLDRQVAAQKATDVFMKAALTGKGRAPKEPKAGEPISTDDLVTGDAFKVKNQDFVVQEIDDAGNVIVQDGPRFGTQVLPPGAPLHADAGTVNKVPREDAMDWPAPEPAPAATPAPTGPQNGELFDTANTFNLASEEQSAPKAPAAAPQTGEMFSASEVRSTAPTAMDRANEAAQAQTGGAAQASPGPAAAAPADAYPENPAPADDPLFTLLPIQLPEMVEFYKAISGGKIPKIVEKIRALNGMALGVFRHTDGPTGTGEIELRADLFNLLSRAEKQALLEQAIAWAKGMKELNPEMNLREAIQQKFFELVKAAEAEALTKDPRRALHVFAHEIGHYVDWVPDKTLKRGNILGHIAALKTYLKGFIGEHPAFQDVEPPNATERARLRRQAEKELEAGVKEIVETIRKEVPVFETIPITPDHITSILKSAQRDEFPDLYDWFASLDRANKAAVLRKAMQGIVDERAARMAARKQTGTQVVEEQVTRRVGPEPTPENIRARYEELLREELKRRGLISERDIKKELADAISWWRGTEKLEDYFKGGTEMLAEAYSIFLNNPAALAKRAPTFMRAWQNYMERRPEVKAAYERIQDEIRSGNVQKQRVISLRKMFRSDDAAGLSHEIVRSKINWKTVRDALRLLFDRQHGPVQSRAIKQLVLKHGVYNTGSIQAQRVLGAMKDYLYRQTAVEAYARQLILRVETPLAQANLRHDDLAEFMFHQRIANGDRQQLANARGWSPKLSLERLREMEATLSPKQWQALGEAMAANRRIYEEFVIAGLKQARVLNPELMRAIEDRVLYSPFNKAREAFNPDTDGTIEGLLQHAYGKEVSARIYRQIGYLGEIRSPYVALTQKAFSLIQFVYEQKALKAIRDYLVEHEPGLIVPAEERFNGRRWIPRIVDTPRIGTLLMLEEGKLQGYYVPREIYETMQRGSPLESMIVGLAHRALAWPKALLTELNAGFWPVAFARDLGAVGLQLPKGYKAWVNIPQAFGAARASFTGQENPLADAALRRLLVISRADPRGEHLGHPDEMTRLLLRMGQSPVLWDAETKKVGRLLRMWMWWKRQGQTLERTTKIAAMMHLDAEEFASMPEWMKKRIINEWAGSPDFLERGRAAPIIEAAGGPIFYNPWLQGLRAFKDAYKYDPAGVWTKFLLWFGLPAAAFFAFEAGLTNLGKDPEEAEDERDMLRSIPERDKLRGFIVPLGWADKKQKKAAYIVLPFPDIVRFLHAGLRKMMQTGAGAGKGDLGLESFLQYQGQDLPGQNPIIAEGMKWYQFAVLGRNPYDEFRGQPTLDEDVFKSGKGATELAKQTVANVTGGIVYRYRPTIPGAPDSQLESFLKLPGVSNLLGRWLRVSNAGLTEEAQRATAEVQKHEAGLRVIADGMMAKTIKGEPWNEKEMRLAANEPYLVQHLTSTVAKKFAEATDPELRLYLRASQSERIALVKVWTERAQQRENRLREAKEK